MVLLTSSGRYLAASVAIAVVARSRSSTAAFAKPWTPTGYVVPKSFCSRQKRFEDLHNKQHTSQLFDLRGGGDGNPSSYYDDDLDDDEQFKDGRGQEDDDRRYRSSRDGNPSSKDYESYYEQERRLSNPSSRRWHPNGGRSSSIQLTSSDMRMRGGSDRYQDDERYYPRNPNNNDDDRYYGDQRQDDYNYYSRQESSRSRRDGYSNNDYDDYRRDDRGGTDQYYSRDYDDYDDRGSSRSPGKSNRVGGGGSVSNILRNGDRRIGMMLLSGGGILTVLGISLFFNKSLLRMGNLLFVAGVPITIGPGRTMGYFFQPKKSRATACLCAGILLVFVGWPVFGIALEVFGLLNLFGNMFPVVTAVLKQMPIVKTLFGNGGGEGNRQRSRSRSSGSNYNDDDDDRYYDDGRYDQDRYGDSRYGGGSRDDADDGRYGGADRYY